MCFCDLQMYLQSTNTTYLFVTICNYIIPGFTKVFPRFANVLLCCQNSQIYLHAQSDSARWWCIEFWQRHGFILRPISHTEIFSQIPEDPQMCETLPLSATPVP